MGKSVKVVDNFDLPMERSGPVGVGRGSEDVTTDDMVIPRLQIIQDLSPQHKKTKDEYIEGAEVRMVFNTATNELYGDSLLVVPVFYCKEYVIWRDQNEGGGFRGAFSTEAEANAELATLEDKDLCEVVATNQQFVLVVDPSSSLDAPRADGAVISMSISQNKVSRKWNTMIAQAGGDRFECMYKLDVVETSNAAGQEYYNWKVTRKGYIEGTALYEMAEKFYEAISSGAADVSRDTGSSTPSPEVNEGEVEEESEF